MYPVPGIATETRRHGVTQLLNIEYRLSAEGVKIIWYMQNVKWKMENPMAREKLFRRHFSSSEV